MPNQTTISVLAFMYVSLEAKMNGLIEYISLKEIEPKEVKEFLKEYVKEHKNEIADKAVKVVNEICHE